jgi:hypothetical protein
MVQNGVKKIQAAAYNGPRMVYYFIPKLFSKWKACMTNIVYKEWFLFQVEIRKKILEFVV